MFASTSQSSDAQYHQCLQPGQLSVEMIKLTLTVLSNHHYISDDWGSAIRTDCQIVYHHIGYYDICLKSKLLHVNHAPCKKSRHWWW